MEVSCNSEMFLKVQDTEQNPLKKYIKKGVLYSVKCHI